MANVGRPSDYRPEFCQQAIELLQNGATDEEVASALGVSARTLYRWQAKYPEFCQSLKIGKDAPDERAVRSLYQRATGYYFIEQQAFKVKEVTFTDGKRCEKERIEIAEVERYQPPDTTAAIFWLKNRRKDEWRDKHDFNVTNDLDKMSDDEIMRALALVQQARRKAEGNGKANSEGPGTIQ